jgi:DNA replication protein DnaC
LVSSTPPATPVARCQFDLCDGSGFVIDEQTLTARDCRCRAARIAQARSRSLEARIPTLFRTASFESSKAIDIERRRPEAVREVRRFIRELESNLGSGRGLWFTGPPGTGKTTMAMIVSKAAIDADHSVAIYSCPRLLAMLRESIDRGGLLSLIDDLGAVDLLHIDDLGAEHRTDWVLEQLYTIVNARYQDERSTLITSNLSRDELAEQLGERIVSRLEGSCELLPFYGSDARRVDYTPAG